MTPPQWKREVRPTGWNESKFSRIAKLILKSLQSKQTYNQLSRGTAVTRQEGSPQAGEGRTGWGGTQAEGSPPYQSSPFMLSALLMAWDTPVDNSSQPFWLTQKCWWPSAHGWPGILSWQNQNMSKQCPLQYTLFLHQNISQSIWEKSESSQGLMLWHM